MAHQITSLTAAQCAAMPRYVRKWINRGLKSGRANRRKAERAIAAHYKCANLPAPKRVVWVGSPIVGALAFGVACRSLEKGEAVHSAINSAVHSAVHSAINSAVYSAINSAVHSAVHSAINSAVTSAVYSAVHSAVHSAVYSAVHSAVHSAIGSNWWQYLGAQYWAGGWFWSSPCCLDFYARECGVNFGGSQAIVDAQISIAESCGWWWPHTDFVIACERHSEIHLDDGGQLHNEAGPAIAWADGWGIYAIHGVRVTEQIVMRPDTITVDQIHAEDNAEVRRVMVERYGLARYVRDAQFEVLDSDLDPLGLPRRLLRRGDLLLVELTNSTLDADGTRRVYHVPCEPELRPLLPNGEMGAPQAMTALNAVASTYGMRGEEYRPGVET